MKSPVAHINLLQRAAVERTTAWALAAVTALTLLGGSAYANHVRTLAKEAAHRRDDVTHQLTEIKARLAAANGEQERIARAKELREQVDTLESQAQAARKLTDAVHGAGGDGGPGSSSGSNGFARALAAMTGVTESGLWLNTLTISNGGKRLELQGDAVNGASVLRFAESANEALAPLAIRLNNLEIVPSAAAAASVPGTSIVSFKLN